MIKIKPKVLDLFSGIGGFSLGLERAGFETVAFCEIDAKACTVLAKHWPHVPVFNDVSTLTKGVLNERGIDVDVICGGFPCQDISIAGRGAGLAGARSGLWFEFHRLIEEIRPQCAIIENVSALRHRGLDSVLRTLAEIGYNAEWHCIPASAVGAPHRRDRVWIVAHPRGAGWPEGLLCESGNDGQSACEGWPADTAKSSQAPSLMAAQRITRADHWLSEPGVGRMVDGLPKGVDRLKQLGNAVVPQIPEMIGRAIITRMMTPANDNTPCAANDNASSDADTHAEVA